jgi:hypothetical protein
LNLGQLHTLTRFDPCRFVVDFNRGVLSAMLDAGGDVLLAAGVLEGLAAFSPIEVQLGGDQFAPDHLGWDGYYALLGLTASN